MNKLNSKNIKLLERVYNLRSDDSTILVSMDKDKEKTIDLRNSTSDVKEELQTKLESLLEEELNVKTEGSDLLFALTSLCQNDYSDVLKSLSIDFSPEKLLDSLNDKMPTKLEMLSNEIKMTRNEIGRVEDKLSELNTRIEELNIRKEEALSNQKILNHYFDLALSNNINVTREEISSLLAKFDFNEEEQKEISKMMMFPEDGLIDYENGLTEVNDTSIEITEEETNNETNDVFEPISFSFADIEPTLNIENEIANNKEEENTEKPFDPIFEPISFSIPEIEPNFNLETETENNTNEVAEEKTPVTNTILSKEEVIQKLIVFGFDELDFASNDIELIINNFDEETINNNVKLVTDLNISKDVFYDNIELLYDKELSEKINALTSVGKLPKDIYLNPTVLTKYNLNELDSAIKVLQESGLEPKNVPLMAY